MPVSVELRWAMSPYRMSDEGTGVRLRVEVICASGMPEEIFAYRLLPTDPKTGESAGTFDHVCSAIDLEEFPVNEPREGEIPPWYRLNFVDILVRSSAEAESFLRVLQEDVESLRRALERLETLGPERTFVFGVACQPAESSSSSVPPESSSSLSCGDLAWVFADATGESAAIPGIPWTITGQGAGSPLESSSSTARDYSSVTLNAGESSQLLMLSGFPLPVLPSGAVIQGLEVRIRLRRVGPEPPVCPQLAYLGLQHPELGLSVNRGNDLCISGPDWTVLQIGGQDDLWGYPEISSQQLQRGEFGVSLVVHLPLDVPLAPYDTTVEVDGAHLTVYYVVCTEVPV